MTTSRDPLAPVLILSKQDDIHADFVGARLDENDIPFERLDPGGVHHDVSYSFQCPESRQEGKVELWKAGNSPVELDQYRSVLFRRASPLGDSADLSAEAQRFQAAESAAVLDGMFSPLAGNVPWFNSPRANLLASDKIAQLRCALRANLRVPSTIVTNDPDKAYAFYVAQGKDLIVKSLSPVAPPRELVPVLLTTRVPPDLDRGHWDSVAGGSSILQQRIDKAADVRVAVIGDRLLACRIESQVEAETTTDWRANGEVLEHHAIPVPAQVALPLLRLRTSLGLRLMHADFCIDRNDNWWFLETNPNGQWLWLELKAKLDVSAAIAEQLSHPHDPLQ